LYKLPDFTTRQIKFLYTCLEFYTNIIVAIQMSVKMLTSVLTLAVWVNQIKFLYTNIISVIQMSVKILKTVLTLAVWVKMQVSRGRVLTDFSASWLVFAGSVLRAALY